MGGGGLEGGRVSRGEGVSRGGLEGGGGVSRELLIVQLHAACLVQSSGAPSTPGPVFCVVDVGEIEMFSIAQRRSPSLKLGTPPGRSAIW